MGSLFGVAIDTLIPEEIPNGRHLRALSLQDHLLRRFGSAELIELGVGLEPALRLRKAADEVYILFSGSALLRMMDTRLDSPTHAETQELELNAPSRVLIPFGIAAGWHPTKSPVQLLRLSTHADTESPAQSLEWDAA